MSEALLFDAMSGLKKLSNFMPVINSPRTSEQTKLKELLLLQNLLVIKSFVLIIGRVLPADFVVLRGDVVVASRAVDESWSHEHQLPSSASNQVGEPLSYPAGEHLDFILADVVLHNTSSLEVVLPPFSTKPHQ